MPCCSPSAPINRMGVIRICSFIRGAAGPRGVELRSYGGIAVSPLCSRQRLVRPIWRPCCRVATQPAVSGNSLKCNPSCLRRQRGRQETMGTVKLYFWRPPRYQRFPSFHTRCCRPFISPTQLRRPNDRPNRFFPGGSSREVSGRRNPPLAAHRPNGERKRHGVSSAVGTIARFRSAHFLRTFSMTQEAASAGDSGLSPVARLQPSIVRSCFMATDHSVSDDDRHT